jgi:hypothetical protein
MRVSGLWFVVCGFSGIGSAHISAELHVANVGRWQGFPGEAKNEKPETVIYGG